MKLKIERRESEVNEYPILWCCERRRTLQSLRIWLTRFKVSKNWGLISEDVRILSSSEVSWNRLKNCERTSLLTLFWWLKKKGSDNRKISCEQPKTMIGDKRIISSLYLLCEKWVLCLKEFFSLFEKFSWRAFGYTDSLFHITTNLL